MYMEDIKQVYLSTHTFEVFCNHMNLFYIYIYILSLHRFLRFVNQFSRFWQVSFVQLNTNNDINIFSLQVRRLPVGDGIWIAHHKYLDSEYVLDFIVERKKVDDLRSSIRDNRYKDQKLRLRVLIHIQITQCFVFHCWSFSAVRILFLFFGSILIHTYIVVPLFTVTNFAVVICCRHS